jgi:hypothetical protein
MPTFYFGTFFLLWSFNFLPRPTKAAFSVKNPESDHEMWLNFAKTGSLLPL